MAKLLAVGAVVLGSGLFGTLAVLQPQPAGLATAAPSMPMVNQLVVHSALTLGVMPEALATAGVTGNQTTAMLQAIAESSSLVEAHAAATIAADGAAAALTLAQEAASRSDGTDGALQAAAAADIAFTSAIAARETAREALFEAATAGLPSETRTLLATVIAGATRNVPPEFRVVGRTDGEWIAIECALRAEARAAQRQTDLAEEHAALLAAVRADEAVIAAGLALASGLSTVDAAFTAACAQIGGY